MTLDIPKYAVVDENGDPTGELVRADEAHRERVLHRIALIMAHDEAGRYVLQYTKAKDGFSYFDASVGGHLEPGETPVQAAIREAHEELGIAYEPSDLILVADNLLVIDDYPERDFYARHIATLYTAKLPKNWRFVPNEEVAKVHLMTCREAESIIHKQPEACAKGLLAICALMKQ